MITKRELIIRGQNNRMFLEISLHALQNEIKKLHIFYILYALLIFMSIVFEVILIQDFFIRFEKVIDTLQTKLDTLGVISFITPKFYLYLFFSGKYNL